MAHDYIAKVVILILMVGIVIALSVGLSRILKGNANDKTVWALTFRIGLSLLLFVLLWVAFGLGWIKPHALFSI